MTFYFVATGNYTGTYEIHETDGRITPRPLDDIKDAAFRAEGFRDLIFNEANQVVARASIDTVAFGSSS